ncbi:MAG: gamma-butyrobetaine hydroxylase-like domain-containing protein, partial [Xanthobacteraceae bacterium]
MEAEAGMGEKQWPKELRLFNAGKVLKVTFENGRAFDLSAEYLRVMSPSAEVKGHTEAERKTVGGKRAVAVIEIVPVGSYAVRLSFDDLHSTGIYTWDYLYELGESYAEKWAGYLRELEGKRLSRD